MADTSDFRNGLCIKYNGDLYTIVQFQHVKPGKGGAFVRTKLKNLTTGRILENTFTAGVKIETARVSQRVCQYLYKDANSYHFMDGESYETFALDFDRVEGAKFMKEGQEVTILVHDESEKILGCTLPPTVDLRVSYTDQGAKGNTANKALKPATLETEVEVQVPLFIVTDDIVRIDTRNGTYMERVKK